MKVIQASPTLAWGGESAGMQRGCDPLVLELDVCTLGPL